MDNLFFINLIINTCTLKTSAKNPCPIFSRLKSSSLVRDETACRSAWQEEAGVQDVVMTGGSSFKGGTSQKSSPTLVRAIVRDLFM